MRWIFMAEKAFINIVIKGEHLIRTKTVEESKMLSVLVCFVASVVQSEGSYGQNLGFGISNPVAINTEIAGAQLHPQSSSFTVHDEPEKDVSYAISYGDYVYLKRHKVEGHDSPYNPEPAQYGPDVDNNYNGKHYEDHYKHDVPRSNVALKRSVGTNSINGYHNPIVITPVEPVVQKHVYFHVPPPGFEDEDLPPVHKEIPPPKTNLNILFIKTPSYDEKNAYLQQLYQSQQALVEDKTLIYVLSKKEETSHPVVMLPPTQPSAPEVFFVKYKFNSNDIVSINDELSLPNFPS